MDTSDNYYVKQNVLLHEYTMHTHVYNLNIVNIPEIISYSPQTKIMVMRKIPNMNISDMYGEEAYNVNCNLFNKIRSIIKILYDNNIEYPDITGYNFIEIGDTVWIIDFEHAKINKNIKNKFIKKFIGGIHQWNPDFK